MKVLKNHVWNMAQLGVCMAEGYLKDKCIEFVTEYLQGFEVTQRRVWLDDEEYGNIEEVLQGIGKPYVMTTKL